VLELLRRLSRRGSAATSTATTANTTSPASLRRCALRLSTQWQFSVAGFQAMDDLGELSVPNDGAVDSVAPRLELDLRIAEVRIQDFRTIADVWTPLRQTLVLIGENNSGKTAFLSALDVAIGNARATAEDLRRDLNGMTASQFMIDIQCVPAVGDDFADEVIQILGAAIQLKDPPFFAMRCKGELDPVHREFTVKRTFLKGWARGRQTAEALLELPNVLVTRRARDLITFNLLDARRDAIEQLRNRRTFWGQLVSDLRLADKLKSDIEATLAELREKLVAGSLPLATLQRELSDLSSVFAHPQLDVKVSPIPEDVENLLRAMDLLLTETGQQELPISVQGMGTRSLSALLIFRAYVRAILATTGTPGTLSVAAFEEPEAHLHPQAQRAVLGVIDQIPGQRLISTHSPFVAGVADVYDIRVFRRERTGTTISWVSEQNPLTGAQTFAAEELAQIRRFIQRRHGEILFARVVGLFEGDTEDAALPIFAKVFWPTGPDSMGISFVNVGGAGNYKHMIVLLDMLKVPWVIFSDGDQAGVDGVTAAGKAIGRALEVTSQEVVFLPVGEDFETYIISQGFRAHAERAVAKFFGPNALEDYKNKNHGQSLKKNKGMRDYSSLGWESRLMQDFMDRNKGTYGAALAEEIVADQRNLPVTVREFFTRIDAILKQ
jgi:putative ATP-dependent endonuclease of the OLD family